MRGFSVFAPLLGAVMLATAIAFAVTVTAYEAQRSAQIRDLAAEIHVKTLPDVFKWDALSTFAVALRNWFYTTYVYSPGYTPFSNVAKKDLVDAILAFLGANPSDPDTLWTRIGGIEYRHYVLADPNQKSNLTKALDVSNIPSPEGIYVKVDPMAAGIELTYLPDFILDVNEGSKVSTIKTKLFGEEGFGIPVYYPAASVEAAIHQTETELQNKQAIGGFLGSAETKVRVGAVEEKMWKVDTPFDEGRALLTPCTEYYVNWRRDKSIGDVYIEGIKDKIREVLENIGWKNPTIYVSDAETEEGMEYKRLVCLSGKIAKIIFGVDGTYCREVPSSGYSDIRDVDGDHVFYTIVNNVKVQATLDAMSSCAPNGSVPARANFEITFNPKLPKFIPAGFTYVDIGSSIIKWSNFHSGCKIENDASTCNSDDADSAALEECKKLCRSRSNNILDLGTCEDLCKKHRYSEEKDCCPPNSTVGCIECNPPNSTVGCIECKKIKYGYDEKEWKEKILEKAFEKCAEMCKTKNPGKDAECESMCEFLKKDSGWKKIDNCGDTILAMTTIHYSNGNWNINAKCVDATSFVKTGAASECATCGGATYYYNGSEFVWGTPPATEWGLCNDGHDNDCDGKRDADDPDCQSPCCPAGTLSGTCNTEDDITHYLRSAGNYRCDRLCTCGVCTGEAQLTSYIGICSGGTCVSKPDETITCSECVPVTFIAYSKKDAICLKDSSHDVIKKECSAGDNEEGKCCCWIPQHTYKLGRTYKIYHMVVLWKTGTSWNCGSEVHIQLYNNGTLVFDKTFRAAGHFAYREEFDVPGVEADTVVITDGGRCYIDYSHILLEAEPA